MNVIGGFNFLISLNYLMVKARGRSLIVPVTLVVGWLAVFILFDS